MDLLSGTDVSKKAEEHIKNNSGVVSSILLTELAFHVRIRKGKTRMEEVLFYIQSLPNIEIVPVNEEIATLAARIRAKYFKKIEKRLTYFDCIHIATAIVTQCEKFITGDKGFKDINDIKIEIY
jgi:predicted nucleic acid-binding protein